MPFRERRLKENAKKVAKENTSFNFVSWYKKMSYFPLLDLKQTKINNI